MCILTKNTFTMKFPFQWHSLIRNYSFSKNAKFPEKRTFLTNWVRNGSFLKNVVYAINGWPLSYSLKFTLCNVTAIVNDDKTAERKTKHSLNLSKMYILRSLIDSPPRLLIFRKFPTQDILILTSCLLNSRKCSNQDIFKSRQ